MVGCRSISQETPPRLNPCGFLFVSTESLDLAQKKLVGIYLQKAAEAAHDDITPQTSSIVSKRAPAVSSPYGLAPTDARTIL